MTGMYERLIDPTDRSERRGVLSVPGSWAEAQVAGAAARMMGGPEQAVVLVVDGATVGVITEMTLYPVLIDKGGAVRGGTPGRGRVLTASPLLAYRCGVCRAPGWSATGAPDCPNGPHGSMSAVER